MTCCLNPDCQQPQNPDDADYCLSCGAKLTTLLRGRYRVVRPIGQGGFGRTYLATDDDRLNSRCVVKQFSPQLHGSKSLDKAIRLFEQEAVRLHELGEHPQIPTLLAYFEHEQRLYLVQQFIEGATLLQELAQHGAFNEQKIREVLVGLLPLLKFVHDHHVIHRDITPSNIIRRTLDHKLVLIDFGVAKLLSAEASGQPGTKIGTEGYAPMEQIRSGKAYPASDLYSLGVTCIYLLTQVKPDDLYNPLEGRWLWRDYLRQRGSSISEPIAKILDKLLQDLVSDRYPTADAAMRDLRVALSRPVATAQPFSGAPLSRSPRPLTSRPPASGASVSGTPVSRPQGSGAPLSQPPSGQPTPSAPRASGPPSRPPLSGAGGRRALLHLTGHSSWVQSVAIAPDGQWLASGGLDNVIKIWNLSTGELLQTLRGHTKPINCLAISPNSQLLVSASDDDTIRIWEPLQGTLKRTLTGHSRDVNSVVIHANGTLLVSGSEDRTIRLWRLDTGELLRAFPASAGMIRSVAISPDGQLLASGGLDNQIKIWNLKSGEQIRSLLGHFNSVHGVVISPDSKTLISGSKDKTIRIWDLATGNLLQTLTGHTDSVNSIALSANGQLLVSGSSDKSVRLWNLPMGSLRATFNEHTNAVNGVALSADGRRVASGSSDNSVNVWQVV